MQTFETELKVNDIIEGTVSKIAPYGVLVTLANKKHGLVHISQLSHKYVENINDHVSLNDVVKVKVMDIDSENNKISLSIKEAMPKPERQVTQNKPITPAEQNEKSSEKSSFENILSSWLKDSNDKQASLNKRAKRKY